MHSINKPPTSNSLKTQELPEKQRKAKWAKTASDARFNEKVQAVDRFKTTSEHLFKYL